MLKTGKPRSEGQIFHRRLISEYITDFTLDNYVSYFELKSILKSIEGLREQGDKKIRDHIHSVSGARSSTYASHAITPVNKCTSTVFPFVAGANNSNNKAAAGAGAKASSAAGAEVPSPKRHLPRHGSVSVFVDPICAPAAVLTMSPIELQDELIAADPSLAEIFQKRDALQTKFFDALQASYKKVKAFLMSLEKEIVVAMVALHKMTEVELLRKENANYIPHIYLKVQSVLKYRELNLLAFRRILRKFLERCACDSLELQHRVHEIDTIISRSNVSQPSLDLREISLELVAIHGTAHKLTYEQTLDQLQQYVARSGRLAPRILPMLQTFFSSHHVEFPPHQERPGSFAIRVLAGSKSLLSEKMITEVLQCPRYRGECCAKFANGEISVDLQGKLRGDDVFVVQSMVASESQGFSNSDSVMELMLMVHSVKLAAAARITAVVPYLAYTRNVASIAALAEMMELMGCNHVVTVDMHSDQVEGMFSIPMESISAKYEFVQYLTTELRSQGNDFSNITIVAPDGNFLGKAKDFADALMRYGHLDSEKQFVSVCTAVKRLNTKTERDAARKHTTTTTMGPIKLATPTLSENDRSSPAVDGSSPLDDTCSSPLATQRTNYANVVVGSREGLMESPTSPNVFDTHFSELDAAVASNMGRMPRDGTFSPTETDPHRSSSTLAIEKALRKQEEGRRAVVTHQVEETRTEYENYTLVGEVRGRLCVILDTVINEAVNISHVAKSLHANGAERIFLVATHAVLSGRYRERLLDAPIELIIVTDSVNQDEVMRDPLLASKFRVVPLAPLLARAIEKIHSENTLSTMFDK